MDDIDPDYYKNLKWIMDNDISLFDLTFRYIVLFLVMKLTNLDITL